MGEWALPRRRDGGVHARSSIDAVADHRPEARWLRGGFWRNFQVKYREINDLHKQMLRTSAQGRGDADGPVEDAGDRPPPPRPVERLLLARAVRRHLHLAHAAGHVRAPDRGRGRGRPRARDAAAAAELRGPRPRRPARGAGSATRARSWPSSRARAAGSGRGTSAPRGMRWPRRSGAGPRRTTRRCGPTRPRGDDPARRRGAGHADVDDQGDVGGAPASIHDLVMVKEAGLSARLFYDDHELRSGLVRFLAPDTTPEAFATAAATELGDLRDGEFAVDHLAPGQVSLSRDGTVAGQPVTVSKTIRLLGDRLAPELVIDLELHHRGRRADRRAARPRAVGPPAGRRRQPVGVVRRRRRPIGPRRQRAGRGRRRDRLRQRLGGRRGRGPRPSRRPTRGGARSRPSRTRSPGSSASTRAAACCSRGRCGSPRARPAGSRCARRSASRATARPRRRRRPREPRPRGAGGEARPARRPRPLLPAQPGRPVHGPRARGRLGRAVPRLERADHRGVLPPDRRARDGRPHLAGTWARRSPATSRPRRRRCSRGSRRPTARAAGPGSPRRSTTRSCRSRRAHDRRTEILWGARDFEVRFGRRPTAMWLPETAVDLATLAALADAGIEATILAPWQADVENLDTRRPYRVDVGGGRHVTVVLYDGDLSGAVSFEPAATADADRFARERIVPRLDASWARSGGATHDGDDVDPLVIIASDGELYGHHQSFRDLFLERLVAPEDPAPDRGFDVVDLADRRRRARRPAAPRDPDPGADVVELPPRRPALVRRVPGRRRTADGRRRCGRRWTGSPAASTRSPCSSRRDLPGLGRRRGRRATRYVDVVIGAVERRRVRGGAAWAGGPPPPTAPAARAARGPALAPGDVRLGRVVLGRPVAAGDAAGAAVRGARGAARRRARGDGPRGAARRRPRDAPLARPRRRRRRDLPPRARRGRPAAARGLTGACEDHRHGEPTRRVREHRRPSADGCGRGRPRARHRARLRRADLHPDLLAARLPDRVGPPAARHAAAAGARARRRAAREPQHRARRLPPARGRRLRRRPPRGGHPRRRPAAGPARLGRAGRDRRGDAAPGGPAGLHARRGRPGHVHRRDRAQAPRAAGAGAVRRVHERRRARSTPSGSSRRSQIGSRRRGVLLDELPERLAPLPLRPRRHHDVPRRRGAGLRRRRRARGRDARGPGLHVARPRGRGPAAGLEGGPGVRVAARRREHRRGAAARGRDGRRDRVRGRAHRGRAGPRGPRRGHRPAVARGDGPRARLAVRAPGAPARVELRVRSRRASSSCAARSSGSTPPGRPSPPDDRGLRRVASRSHPLGSSEVRHCPDASAAHLANRAPALRARGGRRARAGDRGRSRHPRPRRRHRRGAPVVAAVNAPAAPASPAPRRASSPRSTCSTRSSTCWS